MATLTEDMKRVVREQRLGYVASISPDGTPNLSPKGSLTVWDDTHLVFADVESPRTIRNLLENPKTEVNVVDPFLRKGYRFRGTAKVLRAGGEYWKALEMYKGEGADIRRIRAIVIIEVAYAAALVSPVYLLGLNEQDVRRLWEEFRLQTREKTVLDLIPPHDF
ncbi:MAG: pyridoxamine 5'-phosphate oxidase family protein [Thermoplasmata archaeon]|nr:pyridoxamine 5'-phosphate oxidase family protein [Thermoplasmata archaeon]